MGAANRRGSAILLICLLLLVSACAAPLDAPAFSFQHTPTPFQPSAPTGTPFLPLVSTQSAEEVELLPYVFHGQDFSVDGRDIQVTFEGGLAVTIRPGWPCEFTDHRACISLHQDGRLILATVHSGVGGEADALRHALEGTGWNRAGLPLEAVRANLLALQGADLRIATQGAQGEGNGTGDQSAPGDLAGRSDLTVLAAVRVPAGMVNEYYRLPVDDALARLAKNSPELAAALRSGRKLLAIETCGWRHPEEAWAPGVTDTSASVYLIVIG